MNTQAAIDTRGYVHRDTARGFLDLGPLEVGALAPGGEIEPHRDGGWFPAFCRKIHVPLLTNPSTRFYVEPEWRHLEVGHAVELDNNAPHGVRNDGSTPRVHLILELFESPLVLERHVYTGKRALLGGDTVTPTQRPGACA